MAIAKKPKTAILIVGYNRPDNFEQVIASVARNNTNFRTFIKLDNCGDQKVIAEHSDLAAKILPKASVEVRTNRVGINRNVLMSFREVFALDYDRLVYLEDDTVISDNGIGLLISMMDFADAHSELKIGMTQLWSFSLNQNPKDANKLRFTADNLWGAMISAKCYKAIAPQLRKYEKCFEGLEVQNGYGGELGERIAAYVASRPEIPNNVATESIRKFVRSAHNPCWDGQFHYAYLAAGFSRISPLISRCENIGVSGTNQKVRTKIQDVKIFKDLTIPKWQFVG